MPDAFDKPSHVTPVDGEVTILGPGPAGISVTPDAARETARRLAEAADRADHGHVEIIDPDDEAMVKRWAERLGVSDEAVRNTVLAVDGDSEAVALRLVSARPGAD